MTGAGDGGPRDLHDLRELLLDAVPGMTAPPDRLARVAGLVRRRRRRRAAGLAAGAALAVTTVVAGATLLPGPAVRVAPPAAGASPSPRPPAPTAVPAPTASGPAPSPTLGAATSDARRPARAGTGGDAAGRVPGVAFDADRVPAGDPGSDRRRVVATTESPDPGDGTGIFRTVCRYARMNTDDVFAGRGGAGTVPLRTYWGNTSATAAAEGPWTAVGRSTCRGGVVDRSVQWTPSVVDTRTGTPVAPALVHVFYSSGYAGVRPEEVRALPAGLVAVGGTGTAGTRTAWWACRDGGPHRASIPDCGGGEVELVVVLPQCWDGRRTDSTGHRDHLAYPGGRGCPATHPVALPEISFHVVYAPQAPQDVDGWRLSTDPDGAPAGSSATGGWANGWEQPVARTWAEHCVRAAVSCKSHLLGDGRALEGDV